MIALVDYGMGNLMSVFKALEFVGGKPVLVSTPEEIGKASALVLPGVGNFGDGMKSLKLKMLDKAIVGLIESGRPFFGICLGMQLLMEKSDEAPGVAGLGIFKGGTLKFPENGLKVPHIGWNQVRIEKRHACFAGIPDDSFFYFVHSYFVAPESADIISGTTSYSFDFPSCISRENVFATQFHPEKSQDEGLEILRNFARNADT